MKAEMEEVLVDSMELDEWDDMENEQEDETDDVMGQVPELSINETQSTNQQSDHTSRPANQQPSCRSSNSQYVNNVISIGLYGIHFHRLLVTRRYHRLSVARN